VSCFETTANWELGVKSKVTVKTLVIALGLILGFAGILTVAWDISAWMMGAPVATVEPVQPSPSAEKTEAVAPAKSDPAKIEPIQDTKADHNQPVQSGAYDDNWTGQQEPQADVGLSAPSQVQTKSIAPATDPSVVVPFDPDDREAAEEPTKQKSSLPSAQNSDPYKGDDRE
jgi:hypothetical protein